jgi:hypothetical protein
MAETSEILGENGICVCVKPEQASLFIQCNEGEAYEEETASITGLRIFLCFRSEQNLWPTLA